MTILSGGRGPGKHRGEVSYTIGPDNYRVSTLVCICGNFILVYTKDDDLLDVANAFNAHAGSVI